MISLQFAVKEDEQDGSMCLAYASGSNTFGYLGLGGKKDFIAEMVVEPMPLRTLKNRIVLRISCGDSHTLALVSSCLPGDRVSEYHRSLGVDVLGWGDNSCGQILGVNDIKKFEKPVIVSRLIGLDIKDLCCNKNESVCIDTSGNIYEWGEYNEDGIIPKNKLTGISEVKMGNNFKIAKTKNELYFWGNLKSGNRTIKFSDTPCLLSDTYDIESFSVGNDHIIALNKEKEVKIYKINFPDFDFWEQQILSMRLP